MLARFKKQTTLLTVTSKAGFHLRPAAKFASVAKQYKANIEARHKQKSANAKLVNSLISLDLAYSDSFELSAKGKDATQALEALNQTFNELMQDDEPLEEIQSEEARYTSKTLKGDIIAKGVGIGGLHALSFNTTHNNGLSFNGAYEETKQTLTKQKGEIFEAQLALLEGLRAKDLQSFEVEINQAVQDLKGTNLEAKRVDYLDLLRQVKAHMGEVQTLDLPNEPFVLLAHDLLPSHIESLKNSQVVGVILQDTTLTSHTAILLRATQIPSLILSGEVEANQTVVLDASSGKLVLSPNKADIQLAQKRQNAQNKASKKAFDNREKPAITQTGIRIEVAANIANVKSAKEAVEYGAKKVGLFRTEFLFKKEQPSLEEQVKAYKEIFALFESTTVRTLDVGGDKALPYINLPHEDNPFLGVRGVRLFKTHAHILEEQLLAILTAAQGYSVKVMFPMISCVVEFKKLKALIASIAKEHHLNIENIQFGIMVEVPSVLFLLEQFNEAVDFYSIGTNDLTQYLFAIERTHPTLQTNPLSPVVFDALKLIVDKATKPVSICGELASNEEALEKLVNLGITSLSVSSTTLPRVKETVRKL